MKTLKILVLAKMSRPGGVRDFVTMLIKRSSEHVQFVNLPIGQVSMDNCHATKVLYPFLDNIRLFVRIHNEDFDAIQLNPSLRPAALLRDALFMTTLAALGFRKTIVFFHGWDLEIETKIRQHSFLRFLFRWIFKQATVILILAPRFKRFLLDIGFDESKIVVVTTMFDGSLFKGIKRNPKHNAKTILFLSRFIRQKGIYELMEAYQKLSKKFPDIRLVMAGDGPECRQMKLWVNKQGLSDKVIFPGYLSGADKAQALVDADIFVFPTYSEGCPVSLLEAMGAGLAIITTPVGGIPNIITDGENGVLLDKISPDAIAAAMEQMFANDKFCNRIKENNKRKAWKYLEAGVVVAKIEEIYRGAADNSPELERKTNGKRI